MLRHVYEVLIRAQQNNIVPDAEWRDQRSLLRAFTAHLQGAVQQVWIDCEIGRNVCLRVWYSHRSADFGSRVPNMPASFMRDSESSDDRPAPLARPHAPTREHGVVLAF